MPKLQPKITLDGEKLQNKPKNTQKHHTTSCAGCGKTFRPNEKTVSYDFERYYCFRCDDER